MHQVSNLQSLGYLLHASYESLPHKKNFLAYKFHLPGTWGKLQNVSHVLENHEQVKNKIYVSYSKMQVHVQYNSK